MRIRLILLALSVGLLCAACGPPWTVIRQASPNPFYRARNFGVLAMDYRGLNVGNDAEAAHVADKSAEEVASWERDKASLDAAFRNALTHELRGPSLVAPGSAPWTIAPRVTFIEPGFYTYVLNQPTRVELTLFILDSGNAGVLDEVQFECTEQATMTTASPGQRIRTCGQRLGAEVGDYVNARTGAD